MDDLYTQALKSTGDNIDIVTVYAQFLWKIWKKEEAIKYWNKAIESYPEGKELYQAQIEQLR
jgi:tetratricopeptide (TPR) repeat protein